MQREMFGLPLNGVASIIVALFVAVFVPMLWGGVWAWLLIAVVWAALTLGIFLVAAGDDAPLLRYRIISARDRNSRLPEES